MIANTIQMVEFKRTDSFFDYWHFAEVDFYTNKSQKKADEIAERIRQTQICKELPEHCSQLLFLS
jgi:hypothetical protein